MLQSFILKLFILINGFGASSGIIYDNKQIYVVSDDKGYVYNYDLKRKKQQQFELNTQIPAQDITRKDKPDLESIIIHQNTLYALGSGSKENRNDLYIYNLITKESKRVDISGVYSAIQKRFKIDKKDFNIEGFAYHQGYTYLFNRGNGKNKVNAIFKFQGLPHQANLSIITSSIIDLPLINGNQTTFSDAIIVDNQIIFTATIEANSTVQKDGEVKESIIGLIDLDSYKTYNVNVKKYLVIAENKKIEGIALRKTTSNYYHFVICEDNDDDSKEAKIYKLKVSKDFERFY